MKPKLRPSQNLIRWFTPGLHVKRWLALLFAAIVMISLAVGYLLRDFYSGGFRFPGWGGTVSLQFLPRSIRALLFAVAGAGLLRLAFYNPGQSIRGPSLLGGNAEPGLRVRLNP